MTIRVATRGVELIESSGGPRRAVVMTMGALHDGHAELIRRARAEVGVDGSVVVTVFVNPTQFGAGEDFNRYPRSLEADLALCEDAGADTVFTPTVAQMYGVDAGFRPDSVCVDPGSLADILEGAARPGHFRGALTVVAKLIGLTRPDAAIFGEKDFQQLVLIRRMVADLSMPVSVIGVPTVREPDGLARSSRNRFLTPQERRAAAVMPKALRCVADRAGSGVDVALAAGRELIAREPTVDLDYLVITDSELGRPPRPGSARALIAVRIGSTRLIDNSPCTVEA